MGKNGLELGLELQDKEHSPSESLGTRGRQPEPRTENKQMGVVQSQTCHLQLAIKERYRQPLVKAGEGLAAGRTQTLLRRAAGSSLRDLLYLIYKWKVIFCVTMQIIFGCFYF